MNKKFYLIISIFFSITIWISIALSDSYYSSYNLRLKIIDIPESHTPSSQLPEFINVKIKSNGWKLLPLEFGTQKYFYISAKNDSINFTENLFNSVELNPWFNNEMNIIEINPKDLYIKLEPKAEKLIKVKPLLELNFKRGYGLASEILLKPESILVKGPVSEITKLTDFETEPVKLENLDKPTELFLELKKYRSYQTERQNVKVFLDVQRIIENSVSDVLVQINNLPNNLEVVLIPNTVNLTLRGGIENFSKYNNKDFVVTIDYKDIVADTLGYLKPEIQIPKDFTLISVKPDIIRYIIKKY